MKVLISGAGVAGQALAYWLGRGGVACTIVERAPALRTGGQAVDFRGPVHRAVLERMDLWDAIHARRTTPGDLVLLDPRAKPFATLPAVMMAGDVEILRGDLCELLHERARQTTTYRFGERITHIERFSHAVDVTFASGVTETYDIVVGADGLHSNVRALAFGSERTFVENHGHHIATFALGKSFGIDRGMVLFSEPKRAVAITADRALLVHTSERPLRETFDGMGWLVPRVLDALDDARDVFVDAIATVHVDRYARGRVVLLGDAAYGGTLGGQGTSLAIVGAYVLAGELARGEPEEAFARYETTMRPYATRCQTGARRVGGFFAPRTRIGLAFRNFMYWAMTTKPMLGVFERLVKDAASDFALPHYA